MQELLIFLSGFVLCFVYFKFIKKNKKNIIEHNNILSSQNIITSEKNLLNKIPDSIIIINKEKNIIFSNNASTKRFGINIDQNHIAEIIRDTEFLEGVHQAMEKNISLTIKTEIPIPTLQVYEAYIFPSPLLFLGNKKTLFILIKDLTDIYKIQKIKSDFVANASHELRTPLQTIKLGLETINEGHGKNDEKARNNFLSLMYKESIRMEELIQDLLTLSKIEQQEHIRPSHKINLKEILEYVESLYKEKVSQKNLNFHLSLDLNHLNIVGDKDKLIEVFSNLINNAVKYSDPNKNISIQSSIKLKGNLDIAVKDEGIGIPRELLPRISERFFRVDSEKTKKIQGTGLGLAIVKHIVQQHRGEFNIESSEGIGTKVTIRLPLYS
jgi:two-component system phosphate regulon sensor histidine kinase PhoR|tara:strand:+ start:248 stop:1396 length:1149 start_codon:yes stop_codon:yes gene_type:complete